LTVPQVGMGC